jgi:hypothetical protein
LKPLYLGWQDSKNHRWFPVGRLIKTEDRYQFAYVRGVEQAQRSADFLPLLSFPELRRVYTSIQLFPLFANRVMSPSRRDYPNYVGWLRLEGKEKDPLAFLAHSGGKRIHDPLEVFPAASERDGGGYTIHFFIHGHRHMPGSSQQRAETLTEGESLLLQWDAQNPEDDHAISLRTGNAPTGDADMIGFCPRYLSADILDALRRDNRSCTMHVEQINPAPAPAPFRILCRLDFLPSSGIHPFSGDEYKPLA